MIRTLQTFPKIVNTSYALLACDCVLCILSYGSLTKYNDQHNYSNAAICGICKSHNNCINTLKCWIYAKRAGHGQWPFKLCHSSAVVVRRVGGLWQNKAWPHLAGSRPGLNFWQLPIFSTWPWSSIFFNTSKCYGKRVRFGLTQNNQMSNSPCLARPSWQWAARKMSKHMWSSSCHLCPPPLVSPPYGLVVAWRKIS